MSGEKIYEVWEGENGGPQPGRLCATANLTQALAVYTDAVVRLTKAPCAAGCTHVGVVLQQTNPDLCLARWVKPGPRKTVTRHLHLRVTLETPDGADSDAAFDELEILIEPGDALTVLVDQEVTAME